ncbi:MAG: hypothetical protein A2W31_07265, partial [Planctomycetes bacterium RBG_16_64_10]
GELDVALVPSVELFRQPALSVVSDACIACHGPVLSVRLFCRVAPSRICTLAVDEGSRTSAALAQILLYARFQVVPELEQLPIGAGLADSRADAVLLIGDRAMQAAAAHRQIVWDLGDEWYRWSRLPFVFAMWVARAGVDYAGLGSALSAARDQGLAELTRIAETEGPPRGLSASACLAYLRDNLRFVLGPQERRGLERFYRWSVRLGIVPDGYAGTLFVAPPAGTPTRAQQAICGRSACGAP